MTPPPATVSAEVLPFAHRSPLWFERLSLWLMLRRGYRVDHVGAAGQDHGVDLVARRWRGEEVETVYVQCKLTSQRMEYGRLRDDLAKMAAAVAQGLMDPPAVVLFIISWTVSSGLRRRVQEACQAYGWQVEWLGITELDEEIKRHPDVMHYFFEGGGLGQDLRTVTTFTSTRVRTVPFQLASPQQLAPAGSPFINRAAEIAQMSQACSQGALAGHLVVLSGAKGAGKSRLAQEWAYRHRATYVDGQVELDFSVLRQGTAEAASAAVRSALLALGCPAKRIPEGFANRVSLYRSATADRCLLVVLHNVVGAAEVRALRPASAQSLVLVTTDTTLAELTMEGAVSMPVGRLNITHARAMLQSLTGVVPDGDRERVGLETVVGYCDGLALAINVCARRIVESGEASYAWLADELQDEEFRLTRMGEGDASLQVILDSTYRALSEPLARSYRLLAQAPPLATAGQLQAVLGLGPRAASQVRSELRRRHLIEVRNQPDPAAGGIPTVDMHQLIRLHGRELALRSGEHGAESQSLVMRVSQYAASRAAAIDRATILDRLRVVPIDRLLHFDAGSWSPVESPVPGVPTTGEEARRAFEVEWPFLYAALIAAIDAGLDLIACAIADAVWPAMHGRGHDDEVADVFKLGVDAASRLNDARIEARMRMLWSRGLLTAGRGEDALAEVDSAVNLATRSGDDWLLASALEVRGLLLLKLVGPEEGRAEFERARAVFPTEQHRGVVIQDLLVGDCCQALGDYRLAVASYEVAAREFTVMGDGVLAARALARLARASLAAGERGAAQSAAERAVAVAAQVGEQGATALAMLVLAELAPGVEQRQSHLTGARGAYESIADSAGVAEVDRIASATEDLA